MSAQMILEWTFSPHDYFEQVIEISRQDYTMTIEHGTVQANVDSAIYDANPSMRQELHDALNDRFMGAQLLAHRAYELSNSKVTRVHADGRRDIFFHTEPAGLKITGHSADIRVTGKDGNIISDSKRDRVENKKKLAELAATHRPTDRVLDSLLRSYGAAVCDPDDELVHLYEIRDALSTKFGGATAARSALVISSSDWSRLGQLCNNEPLRQGRHRGSKTDSALRDASEDELAEARRIAQAMVQAYLHYLENHPGP